MKRSLKIVSATVVSWLLASLPALACPVCFGASDSPQARGSNLAVFALLGVTVAVLGAFGTFFLHLRKRARMAGEVAAHIPVYDTQGGER